MLSFLKGTLVSKVLESPRGAYFLVDMHGMGFEVLTSQRSVQSAVQAGEPVQLFTHLVVREDALFLVGFNTREERDLFQILQSASGVGTKVALALLSALSVSEIAQAVVGNQHKILTQAKGVGPKLAQKMTIELKEKMTQWRSSRTADQDTFWDAATCDTTSENSVSITPSAREAFQEAETVLLSLGYQPLEISKSFHALTQAPELLTPTQVGAGNRGTARETLDSETILGEALRWLAKN